LPTPGVGKPGQKIKHFVLHDSPISVKELDFLGHFLRTNRLCLEGAGGGYTLKAGL
jgi:hypothetical protein